MTYYRLGVFGGFVVEEAVHNLAGRRIHNLENYDDTEDVGGGDDDAGMMMIVMKMTRDDFGNEYGGNGNEYDSYFKKWIYLGVDFDGNNDDINEDVDDNDDGDVDDNHDGNGDLHLDASIHKTNTDISPIFCVPDCISL